MRYVASPKVACLAVRYLAAAGLTVACLAVTAGPSLAQTADEALRMAKVSSEPAPRVATLQAMQKAEPSVAPHAARAPRQAPNPKLAEASCTSLDVGTGAPGALVFEDGFDAGDLEGWKAIKDHFSARGALDLQFSAQLQGLDGEALLRVELTSPSGHAHQTLEAPVVVAALEAAAPQSRRVDGYPYPVPVRFAVPADGGADSLTVSIPWPLAGTHVVSHGLYGDWTATASLIDATSPGGASVACPAATFTVIP